MREALILAGGMGTRLRSVVSDMPKPMADINGTPFLEFPIRMLESIGVERIILSVGYKSDIIVRHFGDSYGNAEIVYCIEEEPLGTGGAIRKAMSLVDSEEVFILNGDSIFIFDLLDFEKFHKSKNGLISIALKQMENFDRYGTVNIDSEGGISSFNEKKYCERGLINSGVYILKKSIFIGTELPLKFSFEKQILENLGMSCNYFAKKYDGYFIDIGIPEDYARASFELDKIF